MMKRKNIILIIIIFLIVGCDSINTSAQAPSPQVISTVMPRSTPSISTSTASPNATSSTPSSEVTVSCPMVVDKDISLEDIASGTVLVGKGYNYGQSLLDLSTGIKYEVATQSSCPYCVRWAISPDKSLLAGTEELQNDSGQFEKTVIWILNARSEVLEKATFDLSQLYDIRWLDNQNIILHTEQTSKDGTVLLFNPFTREQRYISNKLPDFYTENYLYPTLGWLIEYSANLDWGIYFSYPNWRTWICYSRFYRTEDGVAGKRCFWRISETSVVT